MADIPFTEECLRKQVLRQLLYRRYDNGVDLANIFALQLELFRVGDEATKDTWRACKPFYLDYVGMTEKELHSMLLSRPPTPCTPLSQTGSCSPGRHCDDGKGAHQDIICPPSTNVQRGFVHHETTGGAKNVLTQLSEDSRVGGSVHILPEQAPRPVQDNAVMLVVQETGHCQAQKDSSDFGRVMTPPEGVVAPQSILQVKAMDKVSSHVDVVQVYEPDDRLLAEIPGASSWKNEALTVCRLACNMLKQESAQAESFLSAECARTKSLKLLEGSMKVRIDFRRCAMRRASPLRLQML